MKRVVRAWSPGRLCSAMSQPPRKVGGLYGGLKFSAATVSAPSSSNEPAPEYEAPTATKSLASPKIVDQKASVSNSTTVASTSTAKTTAGIHIPL